MARIAFFPVPEHGHVAPTFAVARSLAAHGHDVLYLTSDALAPAIERRGFRCEVYDPARSEKSESRRAGGGEGPANAVDEMGLLESSTTGSVSASGRAT